MDNTEEALKGMIERDGDYAIGNDLVFLPDFYTMLNDVFIKRVFTEREKQYADQFATPALRFASTFAVKEAIFKAFKQWYPTVTLAFSSIEILRDRPAGKPSCVLHNPLFDILNITISISHDGDYVWAIALIGRESHG